MGKWVYYIFECFYVWNVTFCKICWFTFKDKFDLNWTQGFLSNELLLKVVFNKWFKQYDFYNQWLKQFYITLYLKVPRKLFLLKFKNVYQFLVSWLNLIFNKCMYTFCIFCKNKKSYVITKILRQIIYK